MIRKFIFLIVMASTNVVYADGYCSWENNSFFRKSRLAESVQSVFQYFYPNFQLTPAELDSISRQPGRIVYLLEARKLGYTLTERYCGESRDDDESDAFRHFVASAFLATKMGHAEAVLYLAGHEQFPEKIVQEPREHMDLFNNNQGAIFGARLRQEQKWPLEDTIGKIVTEAFRKLRVGRLKVIKKGSSKCANPETYPSFPKKD